VPESVLTILKFCFLALLYLFLYRVVRDARARTSATRAGGTGSRAGGGAHREDPRARAVEDPHARAGGASG
jgi:hypothetical protein